MPRIRGANATPKSKTVLTKEEFAREVGAWYTSLPSDEVDWAMALVHAALDETHGDLAQTLQIAKEIHAKGQSTENALGQKNYYTVRKSFKDSPREPEEHVKDSGEYGLQQANSIAEQHMARPDAKGVKVFAHKHRGPAGKEKTKTTELKRDEHGKFVSN